jgi:hypothetical protein
VNFTGALWTGTGTFNSIFEGVNEGSGTTDSGKLDNSGCTGCHDPHQTIVGSEYTGGRTRQRAQPPFKTQTCCSRLTYTAAAINRVCWHRQYL